MNENKTGRATLNGAHEHTSASGILYRETADAVTITIAGRAFDNLKKIVAAMNAVEWTDGDNEAHLVLDDFLIGCPFIDNLAKPVVKFRGHNISGVCDSVDMILQAVDTGCRIDSLKHKERLAALRDKFAEFGVY